MSVQRTVIGLQAGYAFWGVFWGGWGVLLPQFRSDLMLTDATVGMTLMGISIGAIPAMLYGSGPIERRPELSLRLLFVLFSLSVLALGFAGNAFALLALLVVVGMTSGLLDVALNVNVALAEKKTGQRLFQKMHGAFPLGVIIAAPVVGLARDAEFSRATILAIIAALMLLPLLTGSAWETNPHAKADAASAFRSRLDQVRELARGRSLLLVSGLVIVFLFLEHAVENWSTLYMEVTYASTASIASLAPSFYMAALFVGRVIAHRLEERISLSQFLRWGGTGTALCLFAMAYGTSLWLTLGAVTLMGLFMAPLVPGLYGWIGRSVPEQHRGRVLGGVTAISYLGYLLSPVFVGGFGSILGLGAAWSMLGIIAALAAVAVVRHGQLRSS